MIAGFVEKLPSRFLRVDELEQLDEAASTTSIAPGSVMVSSNGPMVSIVQLIDHDAEIMYYIGFDPSTSSWSAIDSWARSDYDAGEIEAVLDEWGRETFGDDDVEHSIVDVGD